MEDLDEYQLKIKKYMKENKMFDAKEVGEVDKENPTYQLWKGMYEWQLPRLKPLKEPEVLTKEQAKLKLTSFTPKRIFNIMNDPRRKSYMNDLFVGSRLIPLYEKKMDQGVTKPLVGAIPQKMEYVSKEGDMVAALINKVDCGMPVWLLAVVMLRITEKQTTSCTYHLTDIDVLAGDQTYKVPSRFVIALPEFRADPKIAIHALHKVGDRVMAVCPGTTLFLIGTVEQQPINENDDYIVVLKHPHFKAGKSHPVKIPQRFVISMTVPHMLFHNKP